MNLGLVHLVPTRVLCEDRPNQSSRGQLTGAEVLLCNRLDLRLGQRGKIRCFSRDDSLECLGMMALQVFAQKLHRAALFPLHGQLG